MVVRKVSVFLLVIAFHVVVLGVVYLSTRSDDPDQDTNKPKQDISKKEDPKKTSPEKDTDIKEPKKTPPPEPPKPKYDYVFHTVAKGDYLSGIANKYKVTTKTIMDLNNLKDPNKIFLGQKLKIPVNK